MTGVCCEVCGYPAVLCDDNVIYPCEGSQARKSGLSVEVVTALLEPHRKQVLGADTWINTKAVDENGKLVPVSPPAWAEPFL